MLDLIISVDTRLVIMIVGLSTRICHYYGNCVWIIAFSGLPTITGTILCQEGGGFLLSKYYNEQTHDIVLQCSPLFAIPLLLCAFK